MKLDEVLKGLKEKLNEAVKITGLNSRHPGFKNWHSTTMQLLRELPPLFSIEVNNFKKLTFEETGYRRGRKYFSGEDSTIYTRDLDYGSTILKAILKKGKPEISGTAEDKKAETDKPGKKKTGTKKTSSGKKSKKAESSVPSRKDSSPHDS
jgi:hypothetical protein